jgi:hypothetical protein
LLGADERAGQGSDDEALGLGVRLGVVGVLDPEDVARELDDRVLEATSGADEGYAALACMANGAERPVHVPVRAGRCHEDPGVVHQPFGWVRPDAVRRHPLEAEAHVSKRGVGRHVRVIPRVEVPNDGDHGIRRSGHAALP